MTNILDDDGYSIKAENAAEAPNSQTDQSILTPPAKGNNATTNRSQQPQQKKLSIEDHWNTWHKHPTKKNLRTLMNEAKPVIDKSMRSYAKNASPAVRSKAKVLAVKAFKTYDPSGRSKLSTWLHTQMQPLSREAQSYDTVHTPEKIRFDLAHVNKMHNRFVDENNREPNEDELADYTGLSRKRIAHIRKYDRKLLYESFFDPEDDDDSGSLPGTNKPENLWADFVYAELGEKDKLIYDLKTGRGGRGKPLSVNQIAKKVGISASAVSQRLAKISQRIQEGAEFGE